MKFKKYKDPALNKMINELIIGAIASIKNNPDQEYVNVIIYKKYEYVISFELGYMDEYGGYYNSELNFYKYTRAVLRTVNYVDKVINHYSWHGNELIRLINSFERKQKLEEIFGNELK